MKIKNTAEGTFGIIGLGRFGRALAIELANSGAEVIAVDKDENRVREIREYTEYAFISDDLRKNTLMNMGLHNCSAVIICVGDRIDTSIMTALNLVDLGVPRVIAKAVSAEHGEVLEKLGAEVVFPERDMALRLASKLTSRDVLDFISLSHDIDISELRVQGPMVGKSVLESEIRSRFELNIIAIESAENTITNIDPSYVLKKGDVIAVIGNAEKIEAFERYMTR